MKNGLPAIAGNPFCHSSEGKSEVVGDTDLDTGYAVFFETSSAEELCDGLILEIGIGQLAVQGGTFGQTVKITDTVFLDIA